LRQLTVGPGLAVNLQGPVERLLDELQVVLVVEAVRKSIEESAGDREASAQRWYSRETLVLERLPVRTGLDDGQDVVTSADKHSGDQAVIGLAQNSHRSELPMRENDF